MVALCRHEAVALPGHTAAAALLAEVVRTEAEGAEPAEEAAAARMEAEDPVLVDQAVVGPPAAVRVAAEGITNPHFSPRSLGAPHLAAVGEMWVYRKCLSWSPLPSHGRFGRSHQWPGEAFFWIVLGRQASRELQSVGLGIGPDLTRCRASVCSRPTSPQRQRDVGHPNSLMRNTG